MIAAKVKMNANGAHTFLEVSHYILSIACKDQAYLLIDRLSKSASGLVPISCSRSMHLSVSSSSVALYCVRIFLFHLFSSLSS